MPRAVYSDFRSLRGLTERFRRWASSFMAEVPVAIHPDVLEAARPAAAAAPEAPIAGDNLRHPLKRQVGFFRFLALFLLPS